MSPRARTSVLGRAACAPSVHLAAHLAAIALAASLAGCAQDSAPILIAPEPPQAPVDHAPPTLEENAPDVREEAPFARRDDAAPLHSQGVRAETFTFESKAIGFKMAVAVPEGGHLCIILPESAQDPTACIGVDPSAMLDALPQGIDRPFGVAYARTGDWSYIVMLSLLPADVEAREDIEKIVGDAEKDVREASSLVPKVIADTPNERFDIFRVKDVPVVKFRIDAPHPPDKPEYENATMLSYAAYGGKAAKVTFFTSPKDIDKVMPYAEASIHTLELPPREAPERFGKPRAELNHQGTRTALMIFGPLVAFGVLLFWWLGKSRNSDAPGDQPSPPARKKRPLTPRASAAATSENEEDFDDEDDAASKDEEGSEEDEDATSEGDEDATTSDDDEAPSSEPGTGDGTPSDAESAAKKANGASSEESAPSSESKPDEKK